MTALNNHQILILEISHLPHILAGVKAVQKGYTTYSIILFVTIVLSVVNHLPFVSTPGQMLDKIENLSAYVAILYTAIEFHSYIKWGDIILALIAASLYYSSHIDFYDKAREMFYIPTHTMWHILSGIILYNIVSRAPDKRSTTP